MSQSTDLALGNQTGSAFRTELNSILAAIGSNHMGGSTPTYALAGMQWIDDTGTPWKVYYYDGTDNIMLGKIDPATNKFWLSGQADATEISGVPTVKQIQNGSVKHATTAGSSNAYTLDLGVGLRPAAYVEGMELNVEFSFGNTGAATINVTGSAGSGLGAKAIKLPGGTDPIEGELPNGGQATLRYDGTDFIVMGGLVTGATFGTQTSLASAGTTNLGTIPSRNVLITGTTTITSFGSAASTARPLYMIKFAGVLTLTHNGTSLIIPGGADVTTAANDTALVEYLGSGNWRVRDYTKADGTGLVSVSNSAWVPIKTVSATSVSQTDYIHGTAGAVFDSTYRAYALHIHSCTFVTDGVSLRMRTTADGVTFDSNLLHYSSIEGGADSSIYLTAGDVGNAAGEVSNSQLIFHEPSNSTTFKGVSGVSAYMKSDNTAAFTRIGAFRLSASAILGFRLFASSGNIASIKYTVYGLKEAT